MDSRLRMEVGHHESQLVAVAAVAAVIVEFLVEFEERWEKEKDKRVDGTHEGPLDCLAR
jgi:hypothetical protein